MFPEGFSERERYEYDRIFFPKNGWVESQPSIVITRILGRVKKLNAED
jgi:hypothetical protein